MRFSAGEAAFEGFRVTRHHPAAVVAWSLVSLVSLLATVLTAMPILGPVLGELQTMVQGALTGGAGEPSAAMQMQMTYAQWATLPVSLVTQAVLLPALYRAMRSEGRDRFAFIRLGRDELRVLAVLAAIALLSMGMNQIAELIVSVSDKTAFEMLGGLVSFVLTLLTLYATVRLVLATPATFASGAIDLAAGWRLTKGLFWPLLGLAIMAGVMAAIVILLLVIIALPIWGLVGGAGASFAGAAASAGILLLAGFGMTLITVIVSAPFMAAYRDLTGKA